LDPKADDGEPFEYEPPEQDKPERLFLFSE